MRKINLFEVSLLIACFLVPLVFVEPNFGGMTLSVVDLMTGIMLVAFVLKVKREIISIKFGFEEKFMMALVLWNALSLVWSINFAKSFGEFIWLVESVLVFVMVKYGVKDWDSVTRVLRIWCYGAVITGTLGLAYYYISWTNSGRQVLVGSTVGNPNSLSGYLILTIPIAISFTFRKQLADKVFWLLVVTGLAAALISTSTRGGWLAVLVAISVLAVLLKSKKLQILLVVYVLAFSLVFPQLSYRGLGTLQGVLGVQVEHPTKVSQVSTPAKDIEAVENLSTTKKLALHDSKGTDRLQLWKTGMLMAMDYPGKGAGIGNYVYLYGDYLTVNPDFDSVIGPREPHNSYIKFLAETGIVGLLLFLGTLGVVLNNNVRLLIAMKKKDRYPLIAGCLCGVLAFVIQSSTNSLFHIPRVAFGLWVLTGLMASMYKRIA